MSVETIDGYHLVNIKVDPLYRNPFLLLLTASLVAINSSIDYASCLLRKFQDYSYNLIRVLAQLARRRRVRDGGGRERQIVLPSRVPPKAVVDQSDFLSELAKTDASIVIPRTHSQEGLSFALFLDHETGQASHDPRVVNLAISDDADLFGSIRLIQKLKSRSLPRAIFRLFSMYEYYLIYTKVVLNKRGQVTYDKDGLPNSTLDPDFREAPYTDRNIGFLSCHELQFYYQIERDVGSHAISNIIQLRNTPLSTSSLSEELRLGTIRVFTMKRRWSQIRLMFYWHLTLSTMLVFGYPSVLLYYILTFIITEIINSGLWLHVQSCALQNIMSLGRIFKKSLGGWIKVRNSCKEGEIHMHFDCNCGKKLVLREKQLNNEFKPLLELISDSFFRSVGQPLDNATIPKKDPLFEALYSHTNVQGRQYHREGAVEVLASDVSGPSNNSNVEASGYTPGAKKIKKRNDGNREQHKNKEERDRNGENDNDKEERDGIDAVGKLHERIQKYLIICLPHFNGHRMEHLEISRQVADDKLVKVVKKKYHTQRTIWKRLKSLRGFSTIRLARFELAHTRTRLLPTAIEWSWPEVGNTDWECVSKPEDPLPLVSAVMTHIWLDECIKTSKPKLKRSKVPKITFKWPNRSETLPMSEPSGSMSPVPLSQLVSSIKVTFPECEAPSKSQVIEKEEFGMQWLPKAHIEIDFGHNLVDPSFIFQRTPKKLRTPLTINPDGTTAPIGWAIWVDEDFWVPWYVLLLFGLISISIFVFAVWYTANNGPKANGWTIGGFILTLITFLFSIWVLRAKESKHARA